MQVLVKMSEFRDNLIISENSLFNQHENVGQMRSFVGQVETSVKQLCLANMQVLVKMSEFRDNENVRQNSLFYQHASVGKFGSFVGQVETSGKSANLQRGHLCFNTSCCKRWF